MTEYHFETREFGLSDKGIHLLRSRFNYDTYNYSDIDTISIEKGKELNNWVIILALGLCLTSFSIWYSLRLFDILDNNEVNVIYIEEIIIPLIPFMLGLYCLYSSTRNGIILRVKTSKKANKFSLKEIEKLNKLEDFKKILKDKLQTRVKINS